MDDGDPIVPELSWTPESSSGNILLLPNPLMNRPDPAIFREELMMVASSVDPKLDASIIAIVTQLELELDTTSKEGNNQMMLEISIVTNFNSRQRDRSLWGADKMRSLWSVSLIYRRPKVQYRLNKYLQIQQATNLILRFTPLKVIFQI